MPQAASSSPQPALPARQRAARVGKDLASALDAVIAKLGADMRPAQLARTLSVDKVLASRIVKLCRSSEPLAALHVSPGPDPLRRFLRAARRRDVEAALLERAADAIDAFEALVREEAGNRTEFEVVLSAWLPDSRADFELRRKQPAFRCMSHLKGVAVDTNFASVLLCPSDTPGRLDVVWLFGLLGLKRLSPGVPVRFASYRLPGQTSPRTTLTLDGRPVQGFDGLVLESFCSRPTPRIAVQRAGDVFHYTLADEGFGPRTACDVVTAEVNRADLPAVDESGTNRRHHFSTEITTPSRVLVFDALLHADIDPGAEPALSLYDTVPHGIADAGDPARDIDRLSHREIVQPLGTGISRFGSADVPRYHELLRHACERLGWDGEALRGFRVRIEYPIYGSQVVLSFPAVGRANAGDRAR